MPKRFLSIFFTIDELKRRIITPDEQPTFLFRARLVHDTKAAAQRMKSYSDYFIFVVYFIYQAYDITVVFMKMPAIKKSTFSIRIKYGGFISVNIKLQINAA